MDYRKRDDGKKSSLHDLKHNLPAGGERACKSAFTSEDKLVRAQQGELEYIRHKRERQREERERERTNTSFKARCRCLLTSLWPRRFIVVGANDREDTRDARVHRCIFHSRVYVTRRVMTSCLTYIL